MNRRFKNLIISILSIILVLQQFMMPVSVYADSAVEIIEEINDVEVVEEIIDAPIVEEITAEIDTSSDIDDIEEIEEICEINDANSIDDEVVENTVEDKIDSVKASGSVSSGDFPKTFNVGANPVTSVVATVYSTTSFSTLGPAAKLKLTISGNGKMTEFAGLASVPWKDYRNYIYDAEIEEGVTSISKYTFYECAELKKFSVSDNVATIGEYAFGSVPIEELSLPISTRVAPSAFGNTVKKVTLTKGNDKAINYDKLTYKNTVWYKSKYNVAGQGVDIVIDPEVKAIGNYTFYECNWITELKSESMNSIGDHAFAGCQELTELSLDISDEVTIGNSAFEGCTKLTDIKIPISTKFGSDSFKNCDSIASIDVLSGNGIGTNYTSSGYKYTPWFIAGSVRDIAITLADGIKSIGDYTFAGCKFVTDFTGFDGLTTLTSLGSHAFLGCESITAIKVPEGVPVIRTDTFKDCILLASVDLPSTVKAFGDKAFSNCVALNSINIPLYFEKMQRNTFYGCTLSANELSYEDTSDYHLWYLSQDFDDESKYDLDEYMTKVTLEDTIFLKNTNVPPPVVEHTYKYYLVISENCILENELVVSGDEIPKVETPEVPENGGRVFMGWYLDRNYTNRCVFPFTLVEDTTYIYAKWECEHPADKRDYVYQPGKGPSCFTDGEGYEHCRVCGHTFEELIVIPQIGHHTYEAAAPYYRYRIIDAEKGKARLICLKCGEDQEGPIVDIPPEKEDEAVEQISENKYKVTLVKGAEASIPEIAKPDKAKRWKVTKPKSNKLMVGVSKKGIIKGVKTGHGDVLVDIIEESGEERHIVLDVTVTTPGFTKNKYYVNLGDALYLNEIFGETKTSTDTTLRKEIEIADTDILDYDNTTKAITAKKVGKTNFAISILGKNYKTVKIFVENPELDQTELLMNNGKNVKLKVKGTTQDIEWRSEDETVAKVNTAGNVSPVSTGITFIHAVVNGRDMMCKVMVDKPKINYTKRVLTVNSPDNSEFELKLIDSHDHSDIVWESGRADVATVEGGKVVAKSCGVTLVSCRLNGMKYMCEVTVYDPYIFGARVVKVGKKIALKLRRGPEEVRWEVNDPSIATIDPKKGVVTGKKSGTVIVKAITEDIEVPCTITVK